jgi:hypothetical protein
MILMAMKFVSVTVVRTLVCPTDGRGTRHSPTYLKVHLSPGSVAERFKEDIRRLVWAVLLPLVKLPSLRRLLP